jgi:hypothetical protein
METQPKFKVGDEVILWDCTISELEAYGSSGTIGERYVITDVDYSKPYAQHDYKLKDVETGEQNNWHLEEWLVPAKTIVIGGE